MSREIDLATVLSGRLVQSLSLAQDHAGPMVLSSAELSRHYQSLL